jgi:hypothetical protein
MRTNTRWVDLAIVIAILLTAARLSGLGARLDRWLNPRMPLIQPGMTLPLMTTGGEAERAVVLFLDSNCSICQSSIGFYRRLSDHVRRDRSVHLFITSPADRKRATQDWLLENQVSFEADVIPIDRPWLKGYAVTPTLMIVNRAREVTDIILGKLSPEDEWKVLERLAGTHAKALKRSPIEVSRNDCVFPAEDVQFVDTRDRVDFHSDPERRGDNIPFAELSTRALAELSPRRKVAIIAEADVSRRIAAGILLTDLGFDNVSICATRGRER